MTDYNEEGEVEEGYNIILQGGARDGHELFWFDPYGKIPDYVFEDELHFIPEGAYTLAYVSTSDKGAVAIYLPYESYIGSNV